jgi:hypothetical protein
VTLLTELGERSPKVAIVLISRGDDSGLIRELKKRRLLRNEVLLQPEEGLGFDVHMIVNESVEYADSEGLGALRFLHALVLMQRPRLLATIWGPAVFDLREEPGPVGERSLDWVRKFEEIGLFRRQTGGFIWIHSPCRQQLRNLLGSSGPREKRDHLESPRQRIADPR